MREVEIVRDLTEALTRFNELWDLDDAAGDIAELAGYVLPEAISRAVSAEFKIENLKVDCDSLEEQNAALREANDQQRDSIQKLSAQVVGLRDGLEEILARCETRTMDDDAHYENYYEAKQLLSQPDPGAEIRERLAKLEAVAKITKGYFDGCFADTEGVIVCDGYPLGCANCPANTLIQALAALESRP